MREPDKAVNRNNKIPGPDLIPVGTNGTNRLHGCFPFMKNLVLGVILGIIMAGAVCAYNTLSKITNPSILAQPAKELENAKSETLDCRPVVVYQDRVKRNLSLPGTVVKDHDKKVTASTKVPASDFPNTVTSVYDTGTGATDLYIRRDPLPWLAFDQRWRLGAFYGLSDSENGLFLGVAQYQFAQIKRVHITAHGHADTSGRYFIGAGFTW